MAFNTNRYKRVRNPSLMLVCAGVMFLTAEQVFAEGLVLEEIIVTAQKREESLQDTPIAVSAFTAHAIQSKGIDNISDVADFTPNLTFDTTSPVSGLSSGAVVFIRGIGNTDFSLTTDPGVGTYVDGVYVSRSAGGVLDVLDVERVEVLRGPQGTLFGRNTIGGAINITSRRPAEQLQGTVEATIGNFGRQDVRASIDVPFGDNLRSTLAVSSKTRDGYVDRVLVGDELGDEDKLSVRGTVVYEPSDAWDFQLSLDHTKINEASAGSTIAGFTPGGGTIAFGATLDPVLPADFGLFPPPGQAPAAPAALGALLGSRAETGLAELQQYVTDGEDDISFATGVSGTKLEINGASFIANVHVDAFDLKYTFAYRDTSGGFARDPDNSPSFVTETVNPDYEHEQITHELQITGALFDDRVQYVGGLFLFDEEGVDNVFVHTYFPPLSPAIGAEILVNNLAEVENSSEAAYLQASWDMNDVWSVTGGIRHTRDEKEFEFSQFFAGDENGSPLSFAAALPPGFGAVNSSDILLPGTIPIIGAGGGIVDDDFEETTFKLGVDAKLGDGTLLYYSFSQGFKSGGFVLRYLDARPEPLTFEPETVDSHEIGLKWQGFDDRVRLNAAVFYSDYQEIQVTFFDGGGGPVTANAGEAEIKGIELEVTALLSENLLLDLGYGYTDAEYTEVNEITGLARAIDQSAKLVNTPENSFNLGLEYTVPLVDNELVFRVDYSYTDDIFNDSQNSPFLFQEAYDVFNASIRFSIGESIDVVVFGKNLTDERYIESGDSNFGLGFHEANYNRPREYGATFRYRF